MGHAVPADEPGEHVDGLLLFPLIEGGVNHRRVQHLSGGVHHRHLAAVAVARIQAHGDKPLHRGLHQQGLEVEAEHLDSPLVGLLGEGIADLPLQGGLQQPVPGVVRRGADKLHGRPAGHHRPAHGDAGGLAVQLHAHLQNVLPLAPVDGQHLMAHDPPHRGLKVIVQPVDAVLRLLLRRPGHQRSPAQVQLPQALADGGVVGDGLGDDVAGPLEGGLRRLHPLVRVDEILGQLLGIHRGTHGEQGLRQRLQPLLLRHGGPGAPLGLVGQVQVLHLRQGGGGVNGGGQFFCQLALALDGGLYLLPPLVQVAQVLQPVGQGAQGGVVHGPVELLAVAGDKGNGVALVNEGDHVLNIALLLAQLSGQNLDHGFHWDAPL